MKLKDAIRERLLSFLGLKNVSERIGFEDFPRESDLKFRLDELRAWYSGDSNVLLDFYTKQAYSGFAKDPIYNRNRANYFWGISPREANIKRVHSGLPRAIVDVLQGIVGKPDIQADGVPGLKELLREANFYSEFENSALPFGLLYGYGAWKVSIDPKSLRPTMQWHSAPDVEIVRDQYRNLVAVAFTSRFEREGRKYAVVESRKVNAEGISEIEIVAFEESRGDAREVPLSKALGKNAPKESALAFPSSKRALASPFLLFLDPEHPDAGKGVLDGKIDLFDDLDQSLSQRSQTSRVSTPVEYFPSDLLGRSKENGLPALPKAYNRQYVQIPSGMPDGDGRMPYQQIQTTQPRLDFEQYTLEQRAIVDQILMGVLSPATMGIDVARKDNALAQREKEKITQITRKRIIDALSPCVEDATRLLLSFDRYAKTGEFRIWEGKISVRFENYASPTFEAMAQTLLPLWKAGAMSDERYVDMLYGDTLTEAEKAEEVKRIKENREMQAEMWGNAPSKERDANDEKYDPYLDGEEKLPEEERLSDAELSRVRSENRAHV